MAILYEEGRELLFYGAARDIDIDPALRFDSIHQCLAAVAACGTPAVAGFPAIAGTHTIPAPDYRRRRFQDACSLLTSLSIHSSMRFVSQDENIIPVGELYHTLNLEGSL
jgi:hypothetical protein